MCPELEGEEVFAAEEVAGRAEVGRAAEEQLELRRQGALGERRGGAAEGGGEFVKRGEQRVALRPRRLHRGRALPHLGLVGGERAGKICRRLGRSRTGAAAVGRLRRPG